jgi:ABC-type Fe3+-hydroxamate transport system substrate-binding protein
MIAAAGALDRIVGTDNFSNDPPAVRGLPKVGDMQPNVELIGQLRPDLVLTVATSSHPALGRSLQSLGIRLFVAKVDRLDDVPRVIRTLGRIFDTSTVADRAAGNLVNQLEAYRRTRPRSPRVLFAVFLDPLYVAGRNTFIDDLLELTGAANSVASDGWPQYSLEAVAANPPDIIIVASASRSREQLQRYFGETPPWSDLPAVRRGFWYVVDEDRFARAGPGIPEAAAELTDILDQWEQKQ